MKLPTIIITIFSFGLSFAGILFLQEEQIKLVRLNQSDSVESYKIKETSDKVVLHLQSRIPGLGFNNLLADWNYLNFIQYFGDRPAREAIGYKLTPLFFEVITKNDPRFIRAILVLSTANSVFANSPLLTVKILNKTLETISPEFDPLSPYIWMYKGVDEILFLGDLKAAQNSYEMAAKWALATDAPDKEVLARRNQETANFLAKNPDVTKAQIGAWTIILRGAVNKQTQQVAIKEIKALGGRVTYTPEGGIKVEFPDKD